MTTSPSGSSADWPYGQDGDRRDDSPDGYGSPSSHSHRRQDQRHPGASRQQNSRPSYGQEPYARQPYAQEPYGQQPYGGGPGNGQQHSPRIQPVQPGWPASQRGPTGGASNPLVRPYAMTGGRTRPRYQLAIEALVSTTAQPSQLQGQLPEHQRICQLCREIKSVAEISALLSIPLGVARILVADLAEAGLVAIH
ncbi:DUF742 domain-containing protein, partial [Streptomyces tsukubensis]